VGKGTCDTECDENDVQLATDTYGDSAGSCVGNSRKKALCCDSPKNLSPFLPVALDKVFPTLPPAEDYPQFDLQNLGGDDIISTELNVNTFGFVIIVGPDTAVQSLRSCDGSDLHVLDCENVQAEGSSRVRLICPAESWNSTCDKVHLGELKAPFCGCPRAADLVSMRTLTDRIGTNRIGS
jgi:chitinase